MVELYRDNDERERIKHAMMRQIELRHDEIAESLMKQIGNDIEADGVIVLAFTIQVQSSFLLEKRASLSKRYIPGQSVQVLLNNIWHPAKFYCQNKEGNYELWISEDGQETHWVTTPDRVKL